MRRLTFALAAALALWLALGGAAGGQADSCPGRAGGPKPGGQPGASQAAEGQVIRGELTALSARLGLISIEGPSGQYTVLHVAPKTRITFPDGNIASFGDLRQGQRLRASYRKGYAGQLVADQIDIVRMEPPAGQGSRGQ